MASGPRFGLGPVFAYEWLTRSRRWQAYAIRGLFVLAMLAGLGLVYQSAMGQKHLTTRQQLVQAGEAFFSTMAVTELALILLAAPAATAGAICLDKARGTLAHVMVTDLSDAEVVLGKLGARLVPVLNLVACALPVAALGTLLGGIDPMALTASLLIAAGLAVLGCSLALAFSVWQAKAHEVMIAVYAAWAVWMLALPVFEMSNGAWWAPFWLQVSNPFWLTLAPCNNPGTTTMVEPIVFLLACLLISAGLAALSVARVRPVYLRQSGQVPKAPKPVKPAKSTKAAQESDFAAPSRPRRLWWPGPSLDSNPVLWREWHRNRPSRTTRIVWGLYIGVTSAFSLKVIWDHWMNPTGMGRETAAFLNAFQVLVGLLLLSASAGTVLSEERVRGSLDVLLSTPIRTSAIVWGKWWGAFRRVPWLAFWPALVTLSCIGSGTPNWKIAVACLVPVLIVVQGAAIVSLGLVLATWLPKAGRAVTWTVTALVAATVGWPIIGIMLMEGMTWAVIALVGATLGRPFVAALLMAGPTGYLIPQLVVVLGSPFYNIAMPTILLERNMGFQRDMELGIPIATVFWTVAYFAIALILYLATLFSFDLCMGRTPERPGGEPPDGEEPLPEPTRRPGQAVGAPDWKPPGAMARPLADLSSSASGG
jgi:ABC-type transport system involved in multi-copper enzyme maturation permease subunit